MSEKRQRAGLLKPLASVAYSVEKREMENVWQNNDDSKKNLLVYSFCSEYERDMDFCILHFRS